MKKISGFIIAVFLLLVLMVGSSFAADTTKSTTAIGKSSTSTQVSCTNSITALYSTTVESGAAPYGRTSVTFQNMSSQAVYISPLSTATTATAGIVLTQYMSFTSDRSSGLVSWYCITATSTATVGVTEEK